MRKITVLIAVVALFSLNSNVFAQWQTSGNDIYYNNGNVGIGTSTPSEALTIDGHLRLLTSGNSGSVISSNNGLSFDSGNDWAGLHFTVGKYVDYTKGFHIRNYDSQTLFYVETNGNVGIGTGTGNPTAKLEVNGKIKSSGTNSALILVSPDGTEWEITVDNSGNLTTTQTTKILEVENGDNINVFPNPTENNIKVELNTNEFQEINVELYDISGKMIYMKSYKSNSININISDFEAGTYILKVKNNEGQIIKTEKIVKK